MTNFSSHPEIETRPIHVVILSINYPGQEPSNIEKTTNWLKENIAAQNMVLLGNEVIPDDQNTLIQAIRQATKLTPSADLMFVVGEQSFARNDLWLKVTDELLEKKIPGFAERLRLLAFDKDDPSEAMYIQATAGKYRRMLIFAMPQDFSIIQLAFHSLILPSIKPHVFELRNKS